MSEFKLNVSIKIGERQLTARADEKDELEANMAYLIETFGKEPVSPQKPVSTNRSESQPNLGSCPKCGAGMVHNPKTGKNFCKDKCWLK